MNDTRHTTRSRAVTAALAITTLIGGAGAMLAPTDALRVVSLGVFAVAFVYADWRDAPEAGRRQ